MKSDKSWQQLGCVLEQLEKLKAAIELIATDGDTNITDLKAQSPVVDECENNLDLIVKRVEEFREQSLGVLRRDLEPIFRDRYAEAVRDLNTALSTAVEKNQVVRDIFNAAERHFGQSQNVIHLLTWKELLIDPQAQSKLLAWRNHVKQAGYISLD